MWFENVFHMCEHELNSLGLEHAWKKRCPHANIRLLKYIFRLFINMNLLTLSFVLSIHVCNIVSFEFNFIAEDEVNYPSSYVDDVLQPAQK